MKFIMLLLSSFAAGCVMAQPSPAPELPTELTVATADIRKVRFDTKTGGLSFELKDRQYTIAGLYEGGRFSDARIAANAAVLTELRLANTVILRVRPSAIGAERYEVFSVVLQYDSLKGD